MRDLRARILTIRRPEDLAGVDVHVGYQSGSHYTTIQALEQFMSPDDVKLKFGGGPSDRVDQLLNGIAPAATVFGMQYYIMEQLGFRKLVDCTFMIAAMVPPGVDLGDMRKYFKGLRRAQADIDRMHQAYTHYYLNELPERHAKLVDVRRFGPGERIVFEPYTREMYEATKDWVEERHTSRPRRRRDRLRAGGRVRRGIGFRPATTPDDFQGRPVCIGRPSCSYALMSRNTTAQAEPAEAQLHATGSNPQAPEFRGPTDRVGHLLRRAFQAAQENSARVFADLGLTPRQAAAGGRFIWRPHVAARTGRGDRHGRAQRARARAAPDQGRLRHPGARPGDPRRMRLTLTDEGKTIAVALPERARASEEATLAALSPKDRAVLVQLLEKLVEPPAAREERKITQPARLNRSFT